MLEQPINAEIYKKLSEKYKAKKYELHKLDEAIKLGSNEVNLTCPIINDYVEFKNFINKYLEKYNTKTLCIKAKNYQYGNYDYYSIDTCGNRYYFCIVKLELYVEKII